MSKSGEMNKADWNKWVHNLLVFLAPLGIIYLTSLLGVLNTPDHRLVIEDLYPTQMVIGAIALYLVNAMLDLLRKFTGGK